MALSKLELTTNHKGAATSTCFVDWKGEPDNGRGGRFIQSSFALWVVEDMVEEEKRRVVAGVDDGTDLNRQANGGCAAFHRDVGDLYMGRRYKSVIFFYSWPWQWQSVRILIDAGY